jgi:hypothetical protein
MESFNGFMDSIFYTSDLEPVNNPDDLKEGKMESLTGCINSEIKKDCNLKNRRGLFFDILFSQHIFYG